MSAILSRGSPDSPAFSCEVKASQTRPLHPDVDVLQRRGTHPSAQQAIDESAWTPPETCCHRGCLANGQLSKWWYQLGAAVSCNCGRVRKQQAQQARGHQRDPIVAEARWVKNSSFHERQRNKRGDHTPSSTYLTCLPVAAAHAALHYTCHPSPAVDIAKICNRP